MEQLLVCLDVRGIGVNLPGRQEALRELSLAARFSESKTTGALDAWKFHVVNFSRRREAFDRWALRVKSAPVKVGKHLRRQRMRRALIRLRARSRGQEVGGDHEVEERRMKVCFQGPPGEEGRALAIPQEQVELKRSALRSSRSRA